MSREMPVELRKLLEAGDIPALIAKAKELGVEVEIRRMDGRKPDPNCPCPVCTAKRIAGNAPADGSGLPNRDAALRHLDKITDELGSHITSIVEAVDGRSLARDKDLHRHIDELTEALRIQGMENARFDQQFNAAGKLIAELQETVRKQVGLLHKRVTKRKGEIAVTTAATAAVIAKTRKAKRTEKKVFGV